MFFQIARDSYLSNSSKVFFYFLTILIVGVGYVVGQIPFGIVVAAQITDRDGTLTSQALEDFTANVNFAAINLDANQGLILILLSFVGGLLGLWFSVRQFHRRSLKTLITPFANIRWSRVFFAFGLWMVATMLLELVSYLADPLTYHFQLDWSKWLPLLLIALTIIPLQTSFEELLFRGYLMQGIGWAFNNRLVALLVTSTLFGCMHLMNPEIKEFGLALMMPYYIGMGLFLGILTLMDDGLELALGIHAATNIFGAAFVTFKGSALQTDALFRVSEVNVTLMLPVFFIFAAVFTFICSKKFGWTDWSKIYGPVNQEDLTKNPTEIADHLINN